jgi:hypothetical protein
MPSRCELGSPHPRRAKGKLRRISAPVQLKIRSGGEGRGGDGFWLLALGFGLWALGDVTSSIVWEFRRVLFRVSTFDAQEATGVRVQACLSRPTAPGNTALVRTRVAQARILCYDGTAAICTIPPPTQLSVTVFITPRLHGPYQGSLANKDSRKHLIFPNSGILTKF